MISSDLLDKLREKDPELYNNATERWIDLQNGTFDLADFGKTRLSRAFLQQELQDAIRAHRHDYIDTWFFTLDYVDVGVYEATIYRRTGMISKEEGPTEAEALLRAYLAALEATE